jgi:HTH-type transcriptional regulator/antitoxin HigA
MKTGFDPRAYADLLVEYLPVGIETEEENERLIEAAGRLMKKGKERSPEEDKLLNLLVTLIEDFEEKTYPMGLSANPALALRELMNEHDLKQTDLLDVFGSQGVVSQVLNGKREISKSQAKKLSERFRLPIDLFI